MHRPLLSMIARCTRLALLVGAMVVSATAARRAEARSGPGDPVASISDSLRGRSGRLRFRIVRPGAGAESEIETLGRLFGPDALGRPGLLAVRDSLTDESFNFANLIPFTDKQNGRVGVYRVGRWPGEVRRPRSEAYRLPQGFIEVNAEALDVQVSTHFRIGQFLTHDQRDVWPKILVLDERLVDKLELIISELRLAGHRAEGLTVLSGFRTPQYNARGKNSGRATDSRHQYGDASDVFVDANGDGRMDDLNHDGRSDIRDAIVFSKIVDRVEAKYPELTGGVGVYRSTPGHGPFVHVDARGERARWGFP